MIQRIWSAIEGMLRRRPWLITLVALIPCAYFSAAGTNQLIAANLFRADAAALSRPPPAPLPDSRNPYASSTSSSNSNNPTQYRSRDVNRILTRNIFDADAGCLTCAPPPPPTETAQTTPDAGGPQQISLRATTPCTGNTRVMGAIEAEDMTWSFVFLRSSPQGPSMPFRVGMTFDNRTVTFISHNAERGVFVDLRQGAGGSLCYFAQIMPPAPAAPPPPPPSATPAGPAPGESPELSAVLDSVQRNGANEYTLPRSAVDRILENQAALMSTTRIMPVNEGGRVVGVQLFGVRGNSLLGRLGMQNGDVLNRLNGLEIASPDRALEAYSRLRSADHITVSVTRNGQPMNLDFNIR